MNNNAERIEELVKLAQQLPLQGRENLVCVAQGMVLATELNAAAPQQSA